MYVVVFQLCDGLGFTHTPAMNSAEEYSDY